MYAPAFPVRAFTSSSSALRVSQGCSDQHGAPVSGCSLVTSAGVPPRVLSVSSASPWSTGDAYKDESVKGDPSAVSDVEPYTTYLGRRL